MLRPILLALSLVACRGESEAVAEEPRQMAEIALPDGPVVDAAHVIPPEQEAALDRALRDYWDNQSVAVVVSTLATLDGRTIEDEAFEQFNRWGIGGENTNRGVLVLIAPNEQQARIEVGCGLETVLTDAVAQRIMDDTMLPALRHGRYGASARAGARAIMAAIADADVAPGPASALCLEAMDRAA